MTLPDPPSVTEFRILKNRRMKGADNETTKEDTRVFGLFHIAIVAKMKKGLEKVSVHRLDSADGNTFEVLSFMRTARLHNYLQKTFEGYSFVIWFDKEFQTYDVKWVC